MTQTIIFKHATIEDLPIIVDIYNSTVLSRMVTADTELITVEDRIAWFHEHTPEKRPLWVIKLEDEICGWVSLQSFYGRPAYDETVEVSIYFDERFRGKGLGKKTLSKIFAECKSLEISTIIGFVFAHNIPSVKLFSSVGFEKWGYLPEVADLDGIKRDVVILGKKIS